MLCSKPLPSRHGSTQVSLNFTGHQSGELRSNTSHCEPGILRVDFESRVGLFGTGFSRRKLVSSDAANAVCKVSVDSF